MNACAVLEEIFNAAVQSVLPGKMIRDHVSVTDSTLAIANLHFSLREFDCIYIIGAGKASALMAKEMENILGDHITDGHVAVKYGHACELNYITVTEAGHPIPDGNSVIAANKILAIANKATAQDMVICLLSGGGSALLTDCPGEIKLSDLEKLNELLLKSGADIKEINTVRKQLSNIKGGQLAKAVYPAALITLILSDVIGDPIDLIASGPTAPNPTTREDAMNILKKHNILQETSPAIIKFLSDSSGVNTGASKAGEEYFRNTHNLIIGSNSIALEAAKNKCAELGINSFILSDKLEGDSVKAAEFLIEIAERYQKDNNCKKPVCLLFGGETTIKVNGNGLGGRNQHLALHAALMLKDKKGIAILSAGTDGSDGPTNAAGAVVNSETYAAASGMGLNIEKFLQEFDSYHFFQKAGGHIFTGPTMTNVMDIMIVIVE